LLTAALLSSTYGADASTDIDSPRETTHMEFHGILSPTQPLFTTKRIFDRDGEPYNIRFTFTPFGSDGTEYTLSIAIDDEIGIVRRNNSQGSAIDSTTLMMLRFNEAGIISEFDCGQPTRSTNPPLLYIDMKPAMKYWLEEPLSTHSFPMTWSIGQGKPLEYDSGNELFPNQLISRKSGAGHTFTFDTKQNGKGRK
jgi:hypothetical protein